MQLLFSARIDISIIWLLESLSTLCWMEMVLYSCCVECSCSSGVFEWREGTLPAFLGVCIEGVQWRSHGWAVDAGSFVYAVSELPSAIHGYTTKAVGEGWIVWRVVIVDGVGECFAMIAATTKSQSARMGRASAFVTFVSIFGRTCRELFHFQLFEIQRIGVFRI